MKMSQLLQLRELISESTPADLRRQNRTAMEPLLYLLSVHAGHEAQHVENIKQRWQDLDAVSQCLLDTIRQLDDTLSQQIGEMMPEYFANSYRLYQDGTQHDSVEHVLNRRLSISPENHEFINSRIKLYTDWQRSGMILRPGLETWVRDLVALDPLYLVDHDHDLLRPAIAEFTREYQRRLRCYTVREDLDQDILAMLPDGQFGFVLAFNFFHYKPLELIKRYLKEIYQKLVAGGTLALTFNDCDRSGGVFLCEQWFMCFTPSTMILSLAKSLGFDIAMQRDLDSATMWVELRKPGQKISLRGGQALSIIRNHPRKS